jgi:pyrroloquinoline quinone biosynthesis protein D
MGMSDSDTHRFSRCEGIIAQEAHGQTVLLRLSDGSYYTLEGVGASVWELCDGARTFDDIVDGVCSDFDATPDVVRGDVREFLDDLVAERLLEKLA